MTRDNLIIANGDVSPDTGPHPAAQATGSRSCWSPMEGQYRCIGLITVKDMDKAQANPNAVKDALGPPARRRRHRRRRGWHAPGRGCWSPPRSTWWWSILPMAIPAACCAAIERIKKHVQCGAGRGRQRRHAGRRAGADRRRRRCGEDRHRPGLHLHHPHRRRRRRAAAHCGASNPPSACGAGEGRTRPSPTAASAPRATSPRRSPPGPIA